MKIDGESLTLEDVFRVSRFGERVELHQVALKRMEESRKIVEKIVSEKKPVYGVTTGFGDLCDVFVKEIELLQENLIRSHAAGVGNYFEKDVVRAAMLLRANSLAKGCSGVRIEVVEKLIEFLNKNIVPAVPKKGSLGASGDLAPLAHIALVLMGEGEAFLREKIVSGKKALKNAGIKPLKLEAKDGLALINGTQVMTGILCLAIHDSYNLLKNAVVASSMSLLALGGRISDFSEMAMMARHHNGQKRIAKTMRKILENVDLTPKKFQTPYTLRCIPQVLGAVLDTLDYVKGIAEIEINSATDNPLIFKDAVSCGNFHGEPVALACDFLSIAITEIGNFSERRVSRLLNPNLSNLPPFLIKNSGLNSGYMIAQYTAASLASENKILSHPATVDTISVSADQEDHVSMGATAALKLSKIVENVETIVAVEFLCAIQALDFSKPKMNEELGKVYKKFRKKIPFLEKDRVTYKDIRMAKYLVSRGDLVHNLDVFDF